MNRGIAFLFLALLSQKSFCQTLSQSTIGQIYNFEVGDTFEMGCSSTDGQGCNSTNLEITTVVSKQVSGNALSYKIQYKDSSWWECNYQYEGHSTDSGTYDLTYTLLDSAIFWYHTYHSLGCDTFNYCYTDSVYIDSAMNNEKVNAHSEGVNGGLGYSNDTAFADGLGEIWCSSGGEEQGVPFGGCSLQYYHKASGEKWGIPVYFNVVSGIQIINHEETSFKLFPNPASGKVTLQLNVTQGAHFKISIFDIQGRVRIMAMPLTFETPGIRDAQLDISNLSNGFYLVECRSENSVFYRKLIIN